METEPVLIPLENDGDLVITFDRGYRVAEVRRAGPGVSPRGVFLVRPGESLYDVPYEAWLARVDQSVRLRELREHRPAEARPPAGGKAFPTRTGNSFWTAELGTKATLVFMLSVYLAQVPDWYHDAFKRGDSAAFFVIACIAILDWVLKLLFDVGLPRWVNRALIAALLVILLIGLAEVIALL